MLFRYCFLLLLFCCEMFSTFLRETLLGRSNSEKKRDDNKWDHVRDCIDETKTNSPQRQNNMNRACSAAKPRTPGRIPGPGSRKETQHKTTTSSRGRDLFQRFSEMHKPSKLLVVIFDLLTSAPNPTVRTDSHHVRPPEIKLIYTPLKDLTYSMILILTN